MNKPLESIFTWTSIIGVMVLHFFYFQPAVSPLFDSDGAIHVLMAQDFVFPDGLFFWGQNRLGSFIPMASYPFVSMGIPSLWVVSVVQVFLLIITFLNFSKGLSNLSKISLSLLLFLPYYHWWFLVSTGQPYIPQLFFLSLIYRLYEDNNPWGAKQWWTFTLYSLLSIWISDLAIVYIGLLALYIIFRDRTELKSKWTTHLLFQGSLAFLFLFFLIRVKQATTSSDEYQQLIGNPSEWIAVFSNVIEFYFREALTFKSHWGQSLGLILVIASTGIILFKNRSEIFKSPWFFITIACFLATVVSHWVFKNGLRYFSLPLAMLLIFSVLRLHKFKWGSTGLLFGLLLWSGSTLFLRNTLDRPTVFMPVTSEVKAFAKEMSYPAIGPYWTVYQYSAFVNPSPTVIADEYWNVRNRWDFETVLRKDSILIFKSEKLNVLSDTITIYKRSFKALSKEIQKGEVTARLYGPLPE